VWSAPGEASDSHGKTTDSGPMPKNLHIIVCLALVASTSIRSGVAAGSPTGADPASLLDDGIAKFDEGCTLIAKGESQEPGSVERRYLLACSIDRKGPGHTEASRTSEEVSFLTERGRERLDEACLEFRESFEFKPTPFALLLVSNCDVIRGKIAAALEKCLEAQDLASKMTRACITEAPVPGGRREVECREATVSGEKSRGCIQGLEPKLSHLTIDVAAVVPGLEVEWGGRLLAADRFGRRIAVDPGRYTISAKAAGYRAFERTVTVGSEHDSQRVVVPELEKLESAVISSGPGPLPWVVGGIGAVALVTGGAFGIAALNSNQELVANCSGQQCPEAMRKTQDRRDTQAEVASYSVAVGVTGIGAAALWIWLSARGTPKTNGRTARVEVQPEPARGGAVLSVVGRF
jgi:hypothetical protein